MHNFLPQKLEI